MKKKPWTILPPEKVTDFTEFRERMEKVRNGTWDKELSTLSMFKFKQKEEGDDRE
jgi:hypothetical protein